ncbi:MAG: hypothetical protein QHD01_24390 [Bradyrhizobium sp.]|uniref:hypothetical protein n=1 Tax=Bradyrhizobium sp. TaxID=376 RepID=UPI0029B9360A|nr:hypothetical protein [Bradyrhizobium sp.]MDX3969711.1 hypothetical protein [Bradyrhizobium sp.]
MKHFAFIAAAMMVAAPAFSQQYDLVLNGGRVMDPETMYDGNASTATNLCPKLYPAQILNWLSY